MDAYRLTTFKTELGWFGLLIDGERVRRLTMGHPSAAAARAVADAWSGPSEPFPPEPEPLVQRLQDYAAGQIDDFHDVEVDTSYLTPLGQRVFKHCRRIPYGQTASYGELAKKAGRSGAARAIGNFMASNRTPLLVPCHRVVASGGRLGGFTAPGGVSFKERLLAIEAAAAPR
jgi:methylated-DNA-[protein]-cysteine S-methyltransferase